MSRTRLLQAIAVTSVTAWSVLRVAWMSDDGLINIRTALNMSVGSGPVFNAGERVQAYTSPLWFWLQYVVGELTGEFIISAVALGAVLSVLGVTLVTMSASNWVRGIAVILGFVLSSTLVDYSTAGLENGLAMVLIVLALHGCNRLEKRERTADVVLIAIMLSFLVLTRFDFAVIVVPIGLWVAVKSVRRGIRTASTAAAVFIGPLVIWASISFAYYGSVLPNTYYAKLNVDIPRDEIIFSGLRYLVLSFQSDPVLLVVLAVGVIGVFFSTRGLHRIASISIVAYIMYVVSIGGDFMAGRFLTTPAVIALWIIATVPWTHPSGPRVGAVLGLRFVHALPIAIFLVGFQPMIIDRPSHDSPPRWDFERYAGIADEAGVYRYEGSSLSGMLLETGGTVEFVDEDVGYRLWQTHQLENQWFDWDPPTKGSGRNVVSGCGGLGRVGMSVGPSVHVVDTCGLTDPFLARRAFSARGLEWRIGHFERRVPEGYFEAIRYADPDLLEDRALRDQLEDIWSRVR